MSENAITRRSFLAGSAGVAAVAAGAGFLSFNAWEQADARGTSDIDHHTAHSLCNSCSSKCGFTGYVVDGKLGKMIGDANHPNCEGTLCGRGYGFASIAYNEDRLTDPLKKNGGKFEKITWDQAYSEIAEKVGNPKASNMVMLGAYVAGTKILKPETIETTIQEMFAGPKAKFIPLNIEAFRRGMACVG